MKLNKSRDFVCSEGVLLRYEGEQSTVVLPEGIREIGERAFAGLKFIQQVMVPQGVVRIAPSAFEGCYLRRCILPDSLLEVGEGAFSQCEYLERLLLPNWVEAIGPLAFLGCKRLQAVTLPQALGRVAHGLFHSCAKLREITLPYGLTAIEGSAFRACRALEKVKIPETVTEIGKDAFLGCHELVILDYPHYAAHIDRFADTPYARLAARWTERYPHKPAPPVFPRDILGRIAGNWTGSQLRDQGFSFFDKDRSYHISRPDEDGVVEVSSWCGDDGPDEDGFGREEYYDWWYLDEQLEPIPGVAWLHGYSSQDMNLSGTKAQWQAARQEAARILRRRREQA